MHKMPAKKAFTVKLCYQPCSNASRTERIAGGDVNFFVLVDEVIV